MTRRPPISKRTDTLFPYTTLFRSYRKGEMDFREYFRIGLGAFGRQFNLAVCNCVATALQDKHDIVGGATARAGQHHFHGAGRQIRSEEHTSELQSLMRISYAVFCLKKKKDKK